MWRHFNANNAHKYYDILDALISSFIALYHRSIKMSPKDASLKKSETKVYRNLYGDFSALEL